MTTTEQAKQVANNFPELNMANYNVDEVAELNAWGVGATHTIDALVAENGRLKEALHLLIEKADESNAACYGTLSATFVKDIARAALGETKS